MHHASQGTIARYLANAVSHGVRIVDVGSYHGHPASNTEPYRHVRLMMSAPRLSRVDAATSFAGGRRRVRSAGCHEPPWFLLLVAHELPAAMASAPVRSLLHGASNAAALS